jgi:hypothetical protein
VGYGLFSDAVFGSGKVDEWWMINSFSKGLQGLADLYQATRERRYLSACTFEVLRAQVHGFYLDNVVQSVRLPSPAGQTNSLRYSDRGEGAKTCLRLIAP